MRARSRVRARARRGVDAAAGAAALVLLLLLLRLSNAARTLPLRCLLCCLFSVAAYPLVSLSTGDVLAALRLPAKAAFACSDITAAAARRRGGVRGPEREDGQELVEGQLREPQRPPREGPAGLHPAPPSCKQPARSPFACSLLLPRRRSLDTLSIATDVGCAVARGPAQPASPRCNAASAQY